MSMEGFSLVSQVHAVTLTLVREQLPGADEVKWQNNQCFKLTFDSPYSQPELYKSFNPDRNSPEYPSCDVSYKPMQRLI